MYPIRREESKKAAPLYVKKTNQGSLLFKEKSNLIFNVWCGFDK
jgi:hypothetical protein